MSIRRLIYGFMEYVAIVFLLAFIIALLISGYTYTTDVLAVAFVADISLIIVFGVLDILLQVGLKIFK